MLKSWLARWRRSPVSSARREAAHPKARLEVMSLEERVVPASATLAASPETSNPKSFVGDFNGDGRSDRAVFSRGIWSVQTSAGNRFGHLTPWARWINSSPARQFTRLVVADFTGDGRDDVAGLMRNGRWYIGVSSGRAFSSSYAESPPVAKYVGFFVGDFDGDRRDDIAGLTATGELRVARSVGLRNFETTTWATGLTGAWTRIVVGDFDGNGVDDLAGLQSDVWQTFLSAGLSFDRQGWGTWGSGASAGRIVVGDFDGDDRTDVGWINSAGSLAVAASTGSSFAMSIWGTVAGSGRFDVGDFNGDGRDDIAAIAKNAVSFTLLNPGSILTRVKSYAMPAYPKYFPAAGDFNGDGAADIALVARGGDMYVLAPARDDVPVAKLFYTIYRGEIRPYSASAPWNPNNSRHFIDATSSALLRRMDFNTRNAFLNYSTLFRGELRRWVIQASVLKLTATSELRTFLAGKLDAKFEEAKGYLSRVARGLSDNQYRLLMAMNLVHGHYVFGKGPRCTTVWQLLNAKRGNCAHHAHLVRELATIMGIKSAHYGMSVDVDTKEGAFSTGHNFIIAEGMLIDAEINTAFRIGSVTALTGSNPAARLSRLLATNRVHGFYNWLNYFPVRNEQISRRQDGGVLQFLYQHILQGFGSPRSRITLIPGGPR